MKRLIFWDFPRGGWQYDVVVTLILAFIFITPRFLNFKDQPRPASIVQMPSIHGADVYLLETGLLSQIPESGRRDRAAELLRGRFAGRAVQVVRVEPYFDSERELKGYMAIVKP
jgi:hypothetical protein